MNIPELFFFENFNISENNIFSVQAADVLQWIRLKF
jgi:hypothetical protein